MGILEVSGQPLQGVRKRGWSKGSLGWQRGYRGCRGRLEPSQSVGLSREGTTGTPHPEALLQQGDLKDSVMPTGSSDRWPRGP